MRRVAKRQIGDSRNLVGGKVDFFEVVAPRQIVGSHGADKVVFERQFLMNGLEGRERVNTYNRVLSSCFIDIDFCYLLRQGCTLEKFCFFQLTEGVSGSISVTGAQKSFIC